MGLVGSATEDYSDKYEAGIVMSQKTKADKKVDAGTTVEYVVSKGPKVEMVTVPQLIGYSEEDAVQRLTAKGLQAGAVTSESSNTVMAGYVIYQSAPSGSQMEKGSSVDFVVSSGPEATPDPENPSDGGGTGNGTGGTTEGY